MINFEILRKQPLVFHEKNGVKLFEPFTAVDKNKKPLKVFWRNFENNTTIAAKNSYNNETSLYDIEISKKNKVLNGVTIVTSPHGKGIGEVLNLASIIEMKENLLNKIKLFSLQYAIQFFAKYGFNITTENRNAILHNLKYLTKIKGDRYFDKKDAARFFKKQIESKKMTNEKDTYLLSNNLVSDYIRELARDGKGIDGYDLYDDTYMEFNTLDMIRNKNYLNELLDKHEINYTL